MNVTKKQIRDALTEWDRRFRENPEEFESEAVRLIRGTPESYGDVAAPYFISIINELKTAKKGKK